MGNQCVTHAITGAPVKPTRLELALTRLPRPASSALASVRHPLPTECAQPPSLSHKLKIIFPFFRISPNPVTIIMRSLGVPRSETTSSGTHFLLCNTYTERGFLRRRCGKRPDDQTLTLCTDTPGLCSLLYLFFLDARTDDWYNCCCCCRRLHARQKGGRRRSGEHQVTNTWCQQSSPVAMSEGAEVPQGRAAPAGQSALFTLFTFLIIFATSLLLLFGATSLPTDVSLPTSSASFLRRRVSDRFHMLGDRLRDAAVRRKRLHEERERLDTARLDHERREHQQRRLEERVEWNASSRAWEHIIVTNQTATRSSSKAVNQTNASSVALHAATPPPRLHPKLRRVPVTFTLPSPPPPLGPPVLLRFGLESSCLHYQEPLELLARAVSLPAESNRHRSGSPPFDEFDPHTLKHPPTCPSPSV